MTTKPAVESAHHREYFYVGGEYVPHPSGAANTFVLKGQIYVEHLTPVGGVTRPYPIILIHGRGQSGTNWLQTPDGRKGWASYFLDQGYSVFIPDTVSRGRSGHVVGETLATMSTGFIEDYFTATKHSRMWPQAALHTQWPGTGRKGDPIFDAYYASTLPSLLPFTDEQLANKKAGVSLLRHINRPCVVLMHSNGAPMGWLMADACPELVRAIVAIEPNGPPFASGSSLVVPGLPAREWGLTDVPITYYPPVSDATELVLSTTPATKEGEDPMVLQSEGDGCVVRKWPNFKNIPVLVEMGEASYHAPYDHCTAAFLRQVGVQVDFLRLQDIGITGNGHLQMMELNSSEIVRVLDEWIRGKVE